MSWSGQKVLVTGAGGFIGSQLSERLVELGAEVRCLVHYNALGSAGWLDASRHLQGLEIVAGDVRDRDSVELAMNGMRVVFHLAALIAIPYSYDAPLQYVRTNVEGTLNVLQAARRQGIRRLVHTSTSEVYGSARRVPIDEEHPLQGQSPYAASKIGADKLVESFHRSFGVPVVTLRPFNTYGPRQSERAVIPTIITQCLAGGVVRLGNLDPTRDLSFVSDTVEGFLRAAEAAGVEGETFNVGSGREIRIGDLAALIAEVTGTELRIEAATERRRPLASEVDRLLADAGKARSRLGWAPRVSLEDGIARTVAWHREQPESSRRRTHVL